MNRVERMIILVGIVLLVTIPTLVLLLSHPTDAPPAPDPDAIPMPGAVGAQHWHASLVVHVNGRAYDFHDPKYMLQSKFAHFEDDDPFVVHKHTTGVTIPYFLSTLKIFMDKHCLDLANEEPPVKYCTNATNTLRMLVNGVEVEDPERYEIKNNERYLVYYGPLSGVQLQFLANQVPEVPAFREKTPEEMVRELEESGYLDQ